jgi:prophage tail gpP-like protein
VASDLYEAADSFSFEAYPVGDFTPAAGMKCEFYVNGLLEMTGIIDKIERGYESSGRFITITGRDVMSLVVDSYCESFVTILNSNLITVAQRLLRNVPYIGYFIYDDAAQQRDSSKPFIQIEPGQKIFDVLKSVATSRGLVFYADAQGNLLFRKPQGKGRTAFNLEVSPNKPNVTIIKGSVSDDISSRYSRYTVVTQEQGSGESDPVQINAKAVVKDENFPFKNILVKPFVEAISDDKDSPSKLAKLYMEKNRALSRSVNYTVKGHSQNVLNWAIDELVSVKDFELNVNEVLLVYSRTFRGSSQGQYTELKLGIPGLVL